MILAFSFLLSSFSICQSHKCPAAVIVFYKIVYSLYFIFNPCSSAVGLQTSQLTLISSLLAEKCGYQHLICVYHWEADSKQYVQGNWKWKKAILLLTDCFQVVPKMLPPTFQLGTFVSCPCCRSDAVYRTLVVHEAGRYILQWITERDSRVKIMKNTHVQTNEIGKNVFLAQ